MFDALSWARVIATRMALATTSIGSSTIGEYFSKMKGPADEMASAGRRLEDEKLISYILTGINMECNPVVSAMATRVEPISIGELYTQLVSFEQRMELTGGGFQSSVNMVSKGSHGGFSRGAGGHDRHYRKLFTAASRTPISVGFSPSGVSRR